MGDLWTFGDSFASTSNMNTEWFLLINNKFKGKNYYDLFCDARDVQTVMDTFYRNLHNIKKGSLVVVFLPTLARIRYPKSRKYFDYILESSHITNGNLGDMNLKEYFSHWPYQEFPKGIPREELDFPFNHLDLKKIDSELVPYNYKDEDNVNEYQRIIFDDIDSIKQVDFSKFLLTNDANVENWNDIFFSLKKFCSFEILFVSWTDEYNTENVVGKTQLTDEIGFWHTKHEEYEETNGKFGLEWDEHFSTKMNKAFSKWIMKKYPKYFNI